MVVGNEIGAPKNRAGWVWAFFLGWLGVAIVACLSPAEGARRPQQQPAFSLQPATALAAATPAAPAPSWYADPVSAGHVHYWDGSAWTHYAAAPGSLRRATSR